MSIHVYVRTRTYVCMPVCTVGYTVARTQKKISKRIEKEIEQPNRVTDELFRSDLQESLRFHNSLQLPPHPPARASVRVRYAFWRGRLPAAGGPVRRSPTPKRAPRARFKPSPPNKFGGALDSSTSTLPALVVPALPTATGVMADGLARSSVPEADSHAALPCLDET